MPDVCWVRIEYSFKATIPTDACTRRWRLSITVVLFDFSVPTYLLSQLFGLLVMLLRFSVTNHRSIADTATLDMIAAPRLRLHADHVMPAQDGQPSVLPLAVIWGGNASGKSNLVEALQFAQQLVVSSARLDVAINVEPFRLDPAFFDLPSSFEFVVQVDGKVWRFAFAVTASSIISETLHRELTTKSELVYSRNASGLTWGSAAKFDPEYAKFVAQGLLANELFLSAAANKNLQPMQAIYRWVKAMMIVTPDVLARDMPEMLDSSTFCEFVTDLLASSDTGIQSIEINREPLPDGQNLNAFAHSLKTKQGTVKTSKGMLAFEHSKGQVHHVRVKFGHQGQCEAKFDLNDESSGSQRLYELSPVLYAAQQSPSLVVIDEIDSSLHPTIVRSLVQKFLSHRKPGAQLIAITHDTALLDLDLLRRDEIWFADKDHRGKSQYTSLHEFINRSDVDLDKHYLAGRFNGLPRIRGNYPRTKPKLSPELVNGEA